MWWDRLCKTKPCKTVLCWYIGHELPARMDRPVCYRMLPSRRYHSIVGGLRVPLLDDALSARRWLWVLEDLPALGRTGTTLECQFLQQNATLGNLLQRQVGDAAAARQAD
jgi:hypothetical protein